LENDDMDQRTPPKTLAKMTTLSDPAFTNALGIFVRPARRLFLQRGLGLGALGALTLSAGTLATFPATSYASLDAAMKAWAAGDYQGAAKLLKPRADEGDAEAQFNLGLYYFQGLGGDRNYSEAARLFRDAAEQGHIMAANNLGAMNMDGRGVPRNLPEAWYWFAIVAHRGDQAGGDDRTTAERPVSLDRGPSYIHAKTVTKKNTTGRVSCEKFW
jgi:hypothetical protein